ncbi:MAG: caspase family protein, partial [Planctomycetota bacterium]
KGKVLECLVGELRRKTLAPGFSRRLTPKKRRRFALIVGIDRHRDSRIGRLRFARKDARAVADLQEGVPSVEDEERHTVVLLGEEATRAKIRETLDGFARMGVREKDSVLFYFSGFGALAAGPRGAEPILVTYDASLQDPAKTGLTLSGVAKQLASWKAGSITVILDTSFSREKTGKSLGGSALGDWTEKQMSNTFGDRIALLAAGGASGPAFEMDAFEHGMMTYCLREGLEGEADGDGDGRVTRKELSVFLTERVPFFSRMVGLHQEPTVRFPKGGIPYRVKPR